MVPNLENLYIKNCYFLTNVITNCIFEVCKNLSTLVLFGCGEISDEVFELVIRNCPKLTRLSLEHCIRLGPASFKAIHNRPSHFSQMTEINLNGLNKNFFDQDLEVIVSGETTRSLQKLSLRECKGLSQNSLGIISSYLSEHLTHLWIGQVDRINNDSIKRICECTKLREFEFGRTNNVCDESLARIGCYLTNLEKLRIHDINNITLKGVFALVTRADSLVDFCLSGCCNIFGFATMLEIVRHCKNFDTVIRLW
ncbi:hypothetical protein AKO1_015089 [Acrasis kona]|uniref:F-box/LRR-repeat protein 15-like leucin rich repeat domain-containing protein n=1 Tax=Acrasis kona TaxID=1008807 RepID=A0AAW2YR44_9EUKA